MTRTATLTRSSVVREARRNIRVTRASYPGRVLLALLVLCLVLFVVLPVIGATLWALLWALVVGLVLGAFARLIAPGNGGNMGCLTTSLVGVFGGLIGAALSEALDTGGFARLLLQVASAVVLVMLLRPNRGVGS